MYLLLFFTFFILPFVNLVNFIGTYIIEFMSTFQLFIAGQLFPRIFWYAQSDSVVGSIPSFMLNSSAQHYPGIASLEVIVGIMNTSFNC